MKNIHLLNPFCNMPVATYFFFRKRKKPEQVRPLSYFGGMLSIERIQSTNNHFFFFWSLTLRITGLLTSTHSRKYIYALKFKTVVVIKLCLKCGVSKTSLCEIDFEHLANCIIKTHDLSFNDTCFW